MEENMNALLNEKIENQRKDIDRLYNLFNETQCKMNDTVIIVTEIKTSFGSVVNTVNEMKIKIDKITEAPANNWTSLTSTILTTSIGLTLGYVASKLLK